MSKAESISKVIESYMKADCVSKIGLSKICNVQPSVITRWLSGNHNFELSTIEKIETATGWKLIHVVGLITP